jgi:hypothetical protein
MGMLLRYPYEVRDSAEYFDQIQDVKITKDMLDLAKHIVEQFSTKSLMWFGLRFGPASTKRTPRPSSQTIPPVTKIAITNENSPSIMGAAECLESSHAPRAASARATLVKIQPRKMPSRAAIWSSP